MTRPNAVAKVRITTPGGTIGPFALSGGGGALYATSPAHLVVTHLPTGGLPVSLVYGANYSISGDITAGGASLTATAVLAAGVLTVRRQTPRLQQAAWTDGDGNPSARFESSSDYVMQITQEDQEAESRAFTVPDYVAPGYSTVIPPDFFTGGKVLSYDAVNQQITTQDPEVTQTQAYAAAAALSAANAALSATSVGGTKVTWDRPVIGINTGSPGGPAIGDRYLVDPAGGTGAWVGIAGQIAEFRAPGQWEYSGVPRINQLLEVGSAAYRYSQEAYDIGVKWRPATFAFGGARGQGAPTDQPPGGEIVSVVGRQLGFALTGIGITSPLHSNNARGVPGAMTALLAGDNAFSAGARTLYDGNGLFYGSAGALECYLTQNGTGLIYPACYWTIETSASGVRNVAAKFTQNRCLLVNSVTEASQFVVQADNGLRAMTLYGLGGGSQLMLQTATATQVMASGESAANSVLYIKKDSTTSRSLNTAGTINASGADYADFETKSETCGTIAKGAIVGYDADGYLTDKFSLSVSFGIKSTDPSFVGGDVHITEATHGARPENPGEPSPPARDRDHVHPEDPGGVVVDHDDCPVCFKHKEGIAAWRAAHSCWEDFMRKLPAAQIEWDAAAEISRARVDRIAKAGKVPVVVAGAVMVGGYIEAIAGPDDAIVGQCRTTNVGANIVGRIRVANPSAERLRSLISESVPLDPAWSVIAEVVHS